jgi:hypothetical protein
MKLWNKKSKDAAQKIFESSDEEYSISENMQHDENLREDTASREKPSMALKRQKSPTKCLYANNKTASQNQQLKKISRNISSSFVSQLLTNDYTNSFGRSFHQSSTIKVLTGAGLKDQDTESVPNNDINDNYNETKT